MLAVARYLTCENFSRLPRIAESVGMRDTGQRPKPYRLLAGTRLPVENSQDLRFRSLF